MTLKTMEELADFFASDSRFVGTVKQNEPLFARATMHVGGPATLFLEPSDEDALRFALAAVRENNVPFFVLGGGSNLIISDRGFDGAVICTRKLSGVKFLTEDTERTESVCQGEDTLVPENPLCTQKLSGIKFLTEDTERTEGVCQGKNAPVSGNSLCTPRLCEEFITVAAGASWGSVLTFCREHDVGGLEAFAGLSGTVGGAVYMNATCFGLSACDRLVRVRYVDAATGDLGEYVLDDERRETDWGYKKSPFQDTDKHGWTRIRTDSGVLGVQPLGERVAKNPQGLERGGDFPHKIILSAQFALTKGFDAEKADSCLAQRKEKGHFLAPSAGSVFKNDAAHGVIAGKLIDECGLKGLQIGGARVADWHGNFIVNTGDATAQDVYDLVRLVQKVVAEKTGVHLETEIIFTGTFFSH